MKEFERRQTLQTDIEGFGASARDFDFRVENRKTGALETIAPRVAFRSDLLPAEGTRRQRLAHWVTHPHNPYAVPQRYWDRYSDAEIPAPRLARSDVPDDPHTRRLRHVIGLDLQTPTNGQIHAARRAYFGAVSYVDEQMGAVLSALRDSALERDTIVLVLADHGDMLGERGLWYKMNFFEPACRIPLIVAAPGRFAARRSQALVSLLDILPTLRELSESAPAGGYAVPVDGRSLVPELGGRDAAGEVIGEYLGEAAIAPVVMIRRGRYKFIHSPIDPDQLYDLASDPDERHNVASDAAHASALAGFRAETDRRWSLPQLHRQVLASQRVDVVIVMQSTMLISERLQIAKAALARRLPTVYGYREHVEAGGLVSYGVDLRWCVRRGAYFVDKILRGVPPGDLPIEFPTKMVLSLNLKTAQALGIALSSILLARIDEFIE